MLAVLMGKREQQHQPCQVHLACHCRFVTGRRLACPCPLYVCHHKLSALNREVNVYVGFAQAACNEHKSQLCSASQHLEHECLQPV